jgi:type IV secretion system protein TrbF
MRFKRSSVRYSTTPEPETPYQAAQQCWDERIGSARVQAKNWRLMAFGSLALTFVMTSVLIWQASRPAITPFVVEVDKLGQVKEVGPAAQVYQPNDAQVAFHLSSFISNVRSLSADPIVVRQNWLEAYDYATDRGAATLNEFARTNDPFARIGQSMVAIEVTSVVRVSEHSVQVRWAERTYTNGALTNTERWTSILTLVLKQPRDESKLRKNPLGIYVDGISWSRELASATK